MRRSTVPYLAEEAIERDTAALLAEYGRARGIVLAPPIPIEDIVEKHLRLGVEFDDTHKRFGVPRCGREPDILGAIFFDAGRIVIDESLDPDENPSKEGRYRFTLAHEGGGHWRLHRRLFVEDPAQSALFAAPTVPPIVCRSSQARERKEWQADFYASCLLMPRRLVFAARDEMFPDRRQRVIQPPAPVDHPYGEIARLGNPDDPLDWLVSDDEALDFIARPLAGAFLVSATAMRIRLEQLGLLLRAVPHQHPLAGGSWRRSSRGRDVPTGHPA
jgi:hypothetical protein